MLRGRASRVASYRLIQGMKVSRRAMLRCMMPSRGRWLIVSLYHARDDEAIKNVGLDSDPTICTTAISVSLRKDVIGRVSIFLNRGSSRHNGLRYDMITQADRPYLLESQISSIYRLSRLERLLSVHCVTVSE